MNDSFLDKKIDIDENAILRNSPELLKILLRDRTTGKNIVWATKTYELLGKEFKASKSIKVKSITGENASLIRPRIEKLKYEQKERTKGKAEVFTPTWIVKKQNDFIDQEFQTLELEEYVSKVWLEITCGEAPYMVSRYDSVTGEFIPIDKRVGFIDKKLNRISEEIKDEIEWVNYAKIAYQTSFGYEFQGDSLLIARENLLFTFLDYYIAKFNKQPNIQIQKEIAKIISYNIFQMDGLNYTIPYTGNQKVQIESEQLDLFGESKIVKKDILDTKKLNILTKIKYWNNKRMIEFQAFTREGQLMKFDVVIGNPPYQEEANGKSSKDMPVYHKFVEESYKVGDKVLLITPARFLSNGGGTPKRWNEKMLSDQHLKVAFFEQDSSKIFSGTDIKGGVAVTYRDSEVKIGPIKIFTPYQELSTILTKVENRDDFVSFSEIVSNRGLYRYSDYIYIAHPEKMKKVTDRRLASNAFQKLENLFYEKKPNDDHEYVEVYGRQNNDRIHKWFKSEYLNTPENFTKYKVALPKANGSGVFGEVLSSPNIIPPLVGYTETFIGIGQFDKKIEAESVLKYIKSKFARAMLGILKMTQDNTKMTWSKIPMQDFSLKSDIDWSKSIPEIDQQLYKKYNLNEEEINFIETKVKEME